MGTKFKIGDRVINIYVPKANGFIIDVQTSDSGMTIYDIGDGFPWLFEDTIALDELYYKQINRENKLNEIL